MWNELSRLIAEYKKLRLQEVMDYEKFCIISIVWHSTKIEGCSLTETDTKVLLEHDLTAAGKPLTDHLMVKDHFAAFQFIRQQATHRRRLSAAFVQEIGEQVMRHTGSQTNTPLRTFDSAKGGFRLVQVYVDKKYFPDHKKVPTLMAGLCESVNSRIDGVKGTEVVRLAADLHYNFVNIHPFADGNGRAARLLMNYVQLYHQEPLIKIFTEDRAAYIDALNQTEEQADLEIFREFIGRQQMKFLQEEISKYQKLDKGFMLMF